MSMSLHEYNHPVLILETEQDFINYCNSPMPDNHMDRWNVKSLWVIDIIKEYSKEKYPYNDNIKAIVLNKHPELNADIVSTMVYNSQQYRYYERHFEEGYFLLTQEKLEEFYNNKTKFTLNNKPCSARMIDNKIYCMPKGSKRKYYHVYGECGTYDTWAKTI